MTKRLSIFFWILGFLCLSGAPARSEGLSPSRIEKSAVQVSDIDDLTMRSEGQQTLQSKDVTGLSIWGQWVSEAIPPEKLRHLNPEERNFLLNHPGGLLAVRNSACKALALSYALCGVEMNSEVVLRTNDEETDAIRHFLFSSFISCSQGTKYAKIYTTAHEGRVEDWTPRELMDIFNNGRAIEWSDPQTGHCQIPLTDERMSQVALHQLMTGKLRTLRKGDTRCAQPETITHSEVSEISEKTSQYYRYLGAIGFDCG